MSAIATRLLVEARPTATEVAILHVPAGAVARVHHPAGVREYTPLLPEESWYAVVPGDKDLIGWGAVPCWYGSLAGIRNGRHRLDRDAWHAAARELRSGGVTYVQYEVRDYYGNPRWTATGVRVDSAGGAL
ncbi:hypothetical protein FHR32_005068 [Streptosporangium album]|uniref:Uncharacterized protein n=1 Tax=Streptosporangium album TaxID=47479 RepID=A0A7W7S0H6_9ACTN|nr:hypothetical protein [Streptosporangium album]MBB4940691.1 hypothetical protein [Streptosporangium album]